MNHTDYEALLKINEFFQEPHSLSEYLEGICMFASTHIQCNILLVGEKGKIIHFIQNSEDPPLFTSLKKSGGLYLKKHDANTLLSITQQVHYHTDEFSKIFSLPYDGLFLPVFSSFFRLGTLVLYRKEAFMEENIYQAEIYLSYITFMLNLIHKTVSDRKIGDIETVKIALGNLSYSELESVIYVLNELEGEEGLLITSKIADRLSLTRSVVVNALRKLEAANILETRSLGMKGTYIKILNKHIIDELHKGYTKGNDLKL